MPVAGSLIVTDFRVLKVTEPAVLLVKRRWWSQKTIEEPNQPPTDLGDRRRDLPKTGAVGRYWPQGRCRGDLETYF